MLEHRDEIGHADPDTAVDIAFRIAYCTFARQIMYGPEFESDMPIPWEELVPEVDSSVRGVPVTGARRSSAPHVSGARLALPRVGRLDGSGS